MRDAEPVDVIGNEVAVGFLFKGHIDRFDREPEQRSRIEQILAEVLGVPVQMRTVLRKNPQSLVFAGDLGNTTLP